MCSDDESLFSDDESLLCDEEISVSPASSIHCHCLSFAEPDVSTRVGASSVFLQEDDESFAILLDKEQRFQVGNPYICRLKSDRVLRRSRLKAVQWMIKVGSHFHYSAATLCSAVNFLDRFVEKNLDKPWESWMMDLLSIGCLAIAAKQDEVYVPLLQDLQIGGLEYRFNASAIERMELIILTTLHWRLNAVTPFLYESMLRCLDLDVMSTIQHRVTELIFQALQEIEFLEYSLAVLAASCMWCTLEELVPVQADSHKSKLGRLVTIEKEKVQRCYEVLQELVVDPLVQPMCRSANPTSPPTPVTVQTVTEVAEENGNKYNITSATGTASEVPGAAVAVVQASSKKRARAEGSPSDGINPRKRSKVLLLKTNNSTSPCSYDSS